MENYIRNKKLERIWCVMRNISKKLLEYYDKHKRDLAWRGEVPAYYTWISEIMLQQTRVEAVKPYFARFIEELPTIEALANCEEEKLMKLWQGLGYYSRARNLKKAACQIMENYGGELPAEKKELLQLAGIGPYTAGAISSIAYGRKETAVDGNVIRVISRLFAIDGNVLEGKGRQKIEEIAYQELPEERAGDFNQALMDLGATICIPNGVPLCHLCPLQLECQAYRNKEVEKYPEKKKKKERKLERQTILLVSDGRNFALEKRKDKGLLAGLWQFPMLEGRLSLQEVRNYLKEKGISYSAVEEYEPAIHIFSHVEWHMVSYKVEVERWEIQERNEENWLWLSREEILTQYSVPSAFKVYLDYLKQEQRKLF